MHPVLHDQPASERQAVLDERADAELLRAFVASRDEPAFESLVRRHGPMVFGVCRRLLGNEHDAADAFQAAFIVLARKAGSIRTPATLGAWLYNVAYRTSMKARAKSFKRKTREGQVSVMPEPAVQCETDADDVMAVVDEELRALPDKYQTPVILCDLQGQSRKVVAARLSVPEGTLSSRLAMGRRKLAERLLRRGVTASATALGMILAESAASASVPAPLVAATAKAAPLLASGQTAAAGVSANAAVLSQNVLTSMLLAKVQAVLVAVLTPILLGAMVFVGQALDQPLPDDEASALAKLEKLGAKIRRANLPGRPVVGINLAATGARDEHVKLLPLFKQLQDLTLTDDPVTDAACKYLSELPKLTNLRLAKTGITGAGLKDLAGLTELRELDLHNTGATDESLKELSGLKNLQFLELGRTKVTDAGMRELAALTALKILRVELTMVTDVGMADIAAIQSLESLSLDETAVTDAGVKSLAPLDRLRVLNLSGTKVTDAGMRELGAFKNLRWLSVSRTRVTDAGLTELAAFLQIRTLWLNHAKVTDAGMKDVAKLVHLQSLQLDKTAVTDAGIKELAPLTALGSLTLENVNVSDACIPDLAGYKQLWLLNISGTKVTDAGMKGLATIKQLRWLALHNTAITEAGLKDLATLPGLETLWISWTKITPAGVKEVARLKGLGNLRLGGLHVTDETLKELAPLKGLHTLWLDWTHVTDAGMKDLLVFKNLEELRLDGTGVTDVGLKELAALKRLQRVQVPQTQVTQAAIRELRTAVPQVAVRAEDSGRVETPSDDGRAFWWLLASAAAVAASGLVLWLIFKGKKAVVPVAIGSAVVMLSLVGYRLLPMAFAQPPPAPDKLAAQERRLKGHTGPVRFLRFLQDDKRLLSASGWPGKDHSIRIWDLATDQEIMRIPVPGQVGALEMSADGKTALVGAWGVLLLIDVTTGEIKKSIRAQREAIQKVAFAADGQHVYSAGQDGKVKKWNLEEGRLVGEVRVPGKWARFVAELPGDRLVSIDNTGTVQHWDMAANKELKRFGSGIGWVTGTMLAPGGKQLLVAGWHVVLLDVETGEKLREFRGHQGDVPQLSLSPDGKRLVTGGFDGTLRLWDFEEGALLDVLHEREEFVLSAAYSSDSRMLAVAGGGKRGLAENSFEAGSDHDIRILRMPEESARAAAVEPAWWANAWVIGSALGGSAVVVLLSAAMVMRRRNRAVRKTAISGPSANGAADAVPFVNFPCTACGKPLKAKARLAGKKVKCPHCGVGNLVATPVA